MNLKHGSTSIQEKQVSLEKPIQQTEGDKPKLGANAQDMAPALCRKPERVSDEVNKAVEEGFAKLKQRYIEQRKRNKIDQNLIQDNNSATCNKDDDDDELQFSMEL